MISWLLALLASSQVPYELLALVLNGMVIMYVCELERAVRILNAVKSFN